MTTMVEKMKGTPVGAGRDLANLGEWTASGALCMLYSNKMGLRDT